MYLVKSTIQPDYLTQMIGNPEDLPVIKADKNFTANGLGVMDFDPYTSSGHLQFGATNVFFRECRNFVFDTRDVRGTLYGIHWPSSQATSLQNIVFKLSQREEDNHSGVFMEEGSGGFLNDLVFYGGNPAAQFGNQQYTMRNLTFNGAKTAILQLWNWGWTYKNINVNNCSVGLDMKGPVIGGVTLIDSTFTDTPVGIATGRSPANQTENPGAGSLIMDNVAFHNVKDAVTGPQGTIIPGNARGSVLKKGFAYVSPSPSSVADRADHHPQGNMYAPTGPTVYQASDDAVFPASPALMKGDKVYERSKVSAAPTARGDR